MENILLGVVNFCLFFITVSLLMLLYRVMKGPSEFDKAAALDAMGTNIMAIGGLLTIKLSTMALTDVILLVGILSFIGTVAAAKFLEKRDIIEK